MSKKLDLFFKSNVLVINPDLAKMIGLNEAIVLNQIYYWISVNKNRIEISTMVNIGAITLSESGRKKIFRFGHIRPLSVFFIVYATRVLF
jgi:hypothetical protein